MRALCSLVVCLLLLVPASGQATTYTFGPDEMWQFVMQWYNSQPGDIIRLRDGTYPVGELWPLPLTNSSPTLRSINGAETVVLLGTGEETAFLLADNVYDAHIYVEGITFRSVRQILGREDSSREGSSSRGSGELHFVDNIVEDCGAGPVVSGFETTGCSGLIARNTFRNNKGAAIVIYHTSAAIEDNEIYGNGDGIQDWCCTSPPMRRNHVHDNAREGISTGYYEGGVIEYNVIERNGGTGLGVGSVFTVQHNVIRENGGGVWSGGISMSRAAIHQNDIYGNTEFNLRSVGEHELTHDCTMNWWGSTDPATISEGILDCHDDPEVGVCVAFEPFCDFPGCEAVPVERTSWGSIKALYR